MTVTLHSGDVVAVLDPATGGRLTSLNVAGDELLATVPEDVREKVLAADPLRGRDWYRGSFPLAPWAGTLHDGAFEFDGRQHALPLGGGAVHGLVAERAWDVVGVPTETSADLAVRIGPQLPGGWPFDGLVRQSFHLDGSALRMRLEVHCPAGSMPAIAGFHPWFRRSLGAGRAARVSFSPGRRLIHRDGRHIATTDLGNRPWDDLFVDVSGPPSISWPDGPTLTLVSDAPIWVYYERMPEGFCLEPWTGPYDGLGTRWAAVVSPGDPLVLELSMVIGPNDRD